MFLKNHSSSTLTSLVLGFLLLITAAVEPVYAAKKKLNWRIGLGRMINTVYYGYDTQRCSKDCQSNSTLITTDINKTSSGQVYSTSLVIEYLFGGKKTPALFGVGLDVGTSVGQRTAILGWRLQNSTARSGMIAIAASRACQVCAVPGSW